MIRSLPRYTLALVVLCTLACSEPRSSDGGKGEAFFAAPQGIAAHERYIVVANSAFHYQGGEVRYGQGFISLIDRDSRQVVRTIPSTQPNPQSVEIFEDFAYVVNGGRFAVEGGDHARVTAGGGLDIIDLSGALPPTTVSGNIPLGMSEVDDRIGGYGTLALSADGSMALVGSGTRADIFVIDLGARRVIRGPDNPVKVVATEPGENGLTVVRRLAEGFAVLDFNSDSLCRARSGNVETFSCEAVGLEPELLEGPIDLAEGIAGELLVLMSVANGVYRLPSDTQAKPQVVGTGLAANRLVVAGEHAFVVNSMSHALQRIELKSGRSDHGFVAFAVGSNPYDVVITRDDTRRTAWVTLFGTHQVAVVDLDSRRVSLLGNGTPSHLDGSIARPDGQPPACQDRDLVSIAGVTSLRYGAGGGHNAHLLPAVIQGGPGGAGSGAGASEGVLSLGSGGEIVVHFGDYEVIDGPGPDFIVFENPFATGAYQSFAEPATVALAAGAGNDFVEFPCDITRTTGDAEAGLWAYQGCAGVRPVMAGQPGSCIDPLDPLMAGGDAFDLAELGLSSARLLRLVDLGRSNLGDTTRGFDLDAVVLRHFRRYR